MSDRITPYLTTMKWKYKSISKETTDSEQTQRLNNTLLNDQWIIEHTKE